MSASSICKLYGRPHKKLDIATRLLLHRRDEGPVVLGVEAQNLGDTFRIAFNQAE